MKDFAFLLFIAIVAVFIPPGDAQNGYCKKNRDDPICMVKVDVRALKKTTKDLVEVVNFIAEQMKTQNEAIQNYEKQMENLLKTTGDSIISRMNRKFFESALVLQNYEDQLSNYLDSSLKAISSQIQEECSAPSVSCNATSDSPNMDSTTRAFYTTKTVPDSTTAGSSRIYSTPRVPYSTPNMDSTTRAFYTTKTVPDSTTAGSSRIYSTPRVPHSTPNMDLTTRAIYTTKTVPDTTTAGFSRINSTPRVPYSTRIFTNTTSVPLTCPQGYKKVGDDCLYFLNSQLLWPEARQKCQEMAVGLGGRGDLAVPSDFGVFETYVQSLNSITGYIWLGAITDGYGNWTWVSMETLAEKPAPWDIGEPHNDPRQLYMCMDSRYNYKYHDCINEARLTAVCQFNSY